MNRKETINVLKQYKHYLLYLKEIQLQSKQKQKVLVLKKPFYGRDLVVG